VSPAHHGHGNMVGAGLSSEVGTLVVQLEYIDARKTAIPEEIAGYSPPP
jgi:hypothetical protein